MHGRAEAVELHVAPGEWRGYDTTLQEKQVEMAYYRRDFEPPPIRGRSADEVVRRLFRIVRPSTAIDWLQRVGAVLYPTLGWWRCIGAGTPRQLESLELAWSKAHPDWPLPARCALVCR